MRLLAPIIVVLLALGSASAVSCPSNSTHHSPPVKPDHGNATLCDACLLVAGIVEHNQRVANETIHAAELLVENLCYDLGGQLILDECCLVIGALNEILGLEKQGLKPKQVCQKLGFC